VLTPLIKMYGKDYFVKTWNAQIQTYERMTKNADVNGKTDLYTKVSKTFITLGERLHLKDLGKELGFS